MDQAAAFIIAIGDELLMGQVTDTNSGWIAQQLETIGIKTLRRMAIPDDPEAIKETLDLAVQSARYIIMTGGLGPTKDDLTKKTLADYFHQDMVRDDRITQHITEIYDQHDRHIHARNMDQALIPRTAQILWNRIGTAPGIWIENAGHIFISLPGVPYEMKTIITEEGLPKLKETLPQQLVLNRYFLVMNHSETDIEQKLKKLEAELPDYIKLAFLPNLGSLRLRLSGKLADAKKLTEEMDHICYEIEHDLGSLIVAKEDIPIEAVIGKECQDRGLKIGFAESCTGGLLASRITDIPGSSAYFYGSIVSYDNSIKEGLLGVSLDQLKKEGAVSKSTVLQMAKGAREKLGVDITVAVSGILGPGGGSEEKPVGTVWMAISDANKTEAKLFHFHMDRLQNKQRVANTAFGWLRDWIVKNY